MLVNCDTIKLVVLALVELRSIVLVELVELELLVVGAQVGALVGQWPSLAELTRTFGRSDGRRLLPEARVDEAAPHRGLVEELHVSVRPARQDGKIAVVPLVVDAVEIGVQE